MLGENLRTNTEPLSRRRLSQITGAIVTLFARGHLEIPNFDTRLSELAARGLRACSRSDTASIWTYQWLLGLTGKSVQNVLRGDHGSLDRYLKDFESAIAASAERCTKDYGEHRVTLAIVQGRAKRTVELDWQGVLRLTTAIGALTLTIRGSDKSMYGKLFERLVLGSFLSILGYRRVDSTSNTTSKGVFWLSDSTDLRESDATVLVAPGKLARFDIGFIGPGNSEISKDKLSRFAREIEIARARSSSVTFIVVDRLPNSGKTQKAAAAISAEIVQMSMQYWPRLLAKRMAERLGTHHELGDLTDARVRPFLESRLARINVLDFLSGVHLEEIQTEDQ
jgi:hypothetical protein